MQEYNNHTAEAWLNKSETIKSNDSAHIFGARPIVDPSAEGNVDPNLYPQPKEATHKIRGKNDFLEYLFGTVDQELLIVKTFYFFFYSAFGSLFPLMGVYFKQMGMNAGQCGLIIGLRPFVEFFSAPFWGSWADRWQKGKQLLLASLSCWIIFTLPLGFIQPPATSCMLYENHTYYLYIPDSDQKIVKRSVSIRNNQYNSRVFSYQNAHYDTNGTLFERSFNGYNKKSDAVHYDMSENNLLERNTALNISVNNHGSFYNEAKHIINNSTQTNMLLDDAPKYNNWLKNSLNEAVENKKNSSTIKLKPNTVTQLFSINNTTRDKLLQLQSLNASISKNISEDYTKDSNIITSSLPGRPYTASTSKSEKFFKNRIILEHQKVTAPQLYLPRQRRQIRNFQYPTGQSPLSVTFAANYKGNKHKEWVKPQFSSIVYKLQDIQKTFFLLLLLVIVGEFFSAPAITLADSAVITLLGEDADRYGHQRMFGSLGWGLAMFFVGIALDHSTAFPDHPCGPDIKERNYTICFTIFSVLMGAALITATQINFKYDPISLQEEDKQSIERTKEEQLQSQLSQQLNLPSLQESSASSTNVRLNPPEEKTKMFAQTTREIPEWITVFKQFQDLKCASFLFVAWFMGFGIGLIFTFLFWHLQDYGGTPTLFGVASVINHVSEIFAYFFSFKLIRHIGHVKVLCLGLGGNVLRFLYISWLQNPWWVLPFEFIQGITHAAVWAACCSYIAHNTPTPLRSSAQGVLQGLHHGLGRGCGAVIGGIFVAVYGTTVTFRAYGVLCLVVLVAFIFINFYRKETGFISDLPQSEDPHQVAEVTHLAPHGVPSNAIPRALSSNRLNEMTYQDSSYGTIYQTAGGNLSVPGETKDKI
ncbi:major facilitator superfamily domain-containing protein 6 isoform X2 [Copidosoma floridanum]|uniref:major facilitator superfamily domain-containing protein 6 isoform X2 n=1 Tax=Copidosoma floridanum TaxID=29053 RepID=UPI000C6F4BDC|nr:major facilitator superfamily domain-containing protein 6 isoform X2 [Copidosoma floridanum]